MVQKPTEMCRVIKNEIVPHGMKAAGAAPMVRRIYLSVTVSSHK